MGMAGAEAENQRIYQETVIKLLTDIRDNVFSLNKKFEMYAIIKDPDFANQLSEWQKHYGVKNLK